MRALSLRQQQQQQHASQRRTRRCGRARDPAAAVRNRAAGTSQEHHHHQQLVTLATQCSLDRWPRFAQQAASWGGPVSVAVYVPAPQHTAAADTCLQLLAASERAYVAAHPQQPLRVSPLFAGAYVREGLAALAAAGVSSDVHPLLADGAAVAHRPPYEQLYPINALRNLAAQQAATPLLLFADCDFCFSAGLQEQLHTQQQQQHPVTGVAAAPTLAQQLLQQPDERPVMLVLPPFQLLLPAELPDEQPMHVPRTKAALADALARGRLAPFHCGVFAPARQPLDVDAWLAAPPGSAPYEVAYEEFWEPQGVAVLRQLPGWDEGFRGYGLNKVQHAWHAAQHGFRFRVLPGAFMVTAPHARTSSWRPVPGSAHDADHLQRIRRVYEQFKARVASQTQAKQRAGGTA